jgi:hypothetical protein
MTTARDYLAAVQQRADLCGHYQGVAGDLGRTDVPRLVEALAAALDLADEYERDDREHLDRFGQHHPVAYHPYPRIRIAITAALTPKENDS